jgi:hypothetical protein
MVIDIFNDTEYYNIRIFSSILIKTRFLKKVENSPLKVMGYICPHNSFVFYWGGAVAPILPTDG